MVSLADVFTEPERTNWLKAWLAIHIAKSGFEKFAENEAQLLHGNIYTSILKSGAVGCSGCHTANLLKCPSQGICNKRKANGICKSMHDTASKQPRNCPANVCNKVLVEIVKHHRFSNPSWKGTMAIHWASNAWQIAKAYLPPDGYSGKNSAQDTDLNGLISFMVNCKTFDNKFSFPITTGNTHPPCILTKARDIGKTVRHSSTCKVTDTYLHDIFVTLHSLLTDPKCLANDVAAQEAVRELSKLQTDVLKLTTQEMVDLLEAAHDELKKVENITTKAVDEMRIYIKNCRKDLNAHMDKCKRKLDEHTGKCKEELDEHRKSIETDLQRRLMVHNENTLSNVVDHDDDGDDHDDDRDAHDDDIDNDDYDRDDNDDRDDHDYDRDEHYDDRDDHDDDRDNHDDDRYDQEDDRDDHEDDRDDHEDERDDHEDDRDAHDIDDRDDHDYDRDEHDADRDNHDNDDRDDHDNDDRDDHDNDDRDDHDDDRDDHDGDRDEYDDDRDDNDDDREDHDDDRNENDDDRDDYEDDRDDHDNDDRDDHDNDDRDNHDYDRDEHDDDRDDNDNDDRDDHDDDREDHEDDRDENLVLEKQLHSYQQSLAKSMDKDDTLSKPANMPAIKTNITSSQTDMAAINSSATNSQPNMAAIKTSVTNTQSNLLPKKTSLTNNQSNMTAINSSVTDTSPTYPPESQVSPTTSPMSTTASPTCPP
ncbi:protein starmaker-like [Dreissena polymorpha]|uniref:Uncharacterized protein n=1 Tax=Dreissena polymorpha TaxID=45954 RepID=A0A9D4EGC0_DREPO|nr:protein starmaker-like [Dreissena polymorpha]KAH3780099.1 hypothetical protein DPMN_157909 [Dreissena polymorpha]